MIYLSDSHVFDAEVNAIYPLKKQLQEGDVIRAWGVYKDHSTSKFRYSYLSCEHYQLNAMQIFNEYRLSFSKHLSVISDLQLIFFVHF